MHFPLQNGWVASYAVELVAECYLFALEMDGKLWQYLPFEWQWANEFRDAVSNIEMDYQERVWNIFLSKALKRGRSLICLDG